MGRVVTLAKAVGAGRLLTMWLSVLGASSVLVMRASAQGGSVDRFRPTVAAVDSGGTCETRSGLTLRDDERGALMRFGPKPESSRVVGLVWDTTGAWRRYNDTRGDLRGPPSKPAERGRRTSIFIDFEAGRAILLNEHGVRNEGSMMTTDSAALDAEHLGPPRALLKRLRAACGAPASSGVHGRRS